MTQEPVVIRAAAATDLPEVEELLRSYMAEALNRRWEGSLSALERDGLGREFHTLLAWRGREAVGVAFWHRVYNVHFCVVGGEICDMFVKRHYRNSGTALMLVAAAARTLNPQAALSCVASQMNASRVCTRVAPLSSAVPSATLGVMNLMRSRPRPIFRRAICCVR